jgi:protein-S-isoprenylcysteine O-methyltransferase Ste14
MRVHHPAGNLLVSALLVLAPLGGASERLAHPAPWLAVAAAWLTLTTQPQLGPRRMLADRGDRLSALGILVALLTGLLVAVIDFGYRAQLRPPPLSLPVVGGAIVVAGGISLRVWSIRTLGSLFTATVSVMPDQQVVQSGPYRALRHPSYTGALLTVLGIALVFASVVGAVATLALGVPVYVYRMSIEERALVDQLGEAYRSYRERTWRLVPFVY